MKESADVRAQGLTWGVDTIEAARVWRDLGVTGADAKVAVLDTGVAINHPDLAAKMATTNPRDPRHPGGWAEFDVTGGRVDSLPRDSAEHGTHVTGTAIGGDTSGTAIGVAPDAEYMHGLVIPNGRGTLAQSPPAYNGPSRRPTSMANQRAHLPMWCRRRWAATVSSAR